MKTLICAGVAFLVVGLGCGISFGQSGLEAGRHGIFKVTATIPVIQVDTSGGNDKFVTKTLTTNALINLAKGRAITTAIDKDHEVLAADVTFEESGAASPKSRLVIYDPSENGAAGVKLVVATLSELKFLTAGTNSSNKGMGVGKGVFNATTEGVPADNAIIEGTLAGGGSGGDGHIFDKQLNVSPSGSVAVSGTFKFRFKDSAGALITWDGLVVKGALKLSGKPLGTYIDP
jgi:hypothetical protein